MLNHKMLVVKANRLARVKGVTGYGILQYYLTVYEKDTGKSMVMFMDFMGLLMQVE